MIKPFGAKTARFIRRSPKYDAKLNILEGAIRSSKTWGINAKLIAMVIDEYPDWTWPGGIGLISAKSKNSAYTNMLADIFSIVGSKRYRYNKQSGELILCGKRFQVCGAHDDRAWELIRGATFGLWIADELTLHPESFFKMALSRLSLPGSKAYGSTNPGNPYHYVKREYLDNQALREAGDVWSEHFTLDDNPNLPAEVRASYERIYQGVFRRWYILGEWCIAEGAIYRDVLSEENYYDDSSRPLALLSPGGHVEHWIAIDAGVMNPQVYLDIYDDGRTIWWEREYYYDGRKENRQKTDKEYADDLILGSPVSNWPGFPKDQRRWPGVIIDPSAASFKAELLSRGVFVVDGDNEVDNGIRRTAALLGQKKIRIHRKNCPNAVREMGTYAWDEKKAKTGVEEPIKSNDHVPDAGRYHVNTRIMDWRIAA